MNKIKIITDSAADLPDYIYKEKEIEVIPMLVNVGGETYKDGTELRFPELVKKMEYSDEFPSTAQINPQRFSEHYKKYLDLGYKIVSIHLSSKMSGTYQSACIAKDMLETEDIVVIDSLNVTSGLGLLVLKASKLKEDGFSIYEIENIIKQAIPHVKSSLIFGSLDNLVKGGRLSKTAGVVGNLLGIKLILEVNDGEMKVREKVRGTKKAIKNAISYVNEKGIKNDEPSVFLSTADEELYEIYKSHLLKITDKYIESEVGCVVGVHAGTSGVGIFFIENY